MIRSKLQQRWLRHLFFYGVSLSVIATSQEVFAADEEATVHGFVVEEAQPQVAAEEESEEEGEEELLEAEETEAAQESREEGLEEALEQSHAKANKFKQKAEKALRGEAEAEATLSRAESELAELHEESAEAIRRES